MKLVATEELAADPHQVLNQLSRESNPVIMEKGQPNGILTPTIKELRKKLAADQPVYGLWITLEAPSISEKTMSLGLDRIVIESNSLPKPKN